MVELALQGVLGAVASVIFLIIGGIACCTVRCFRPQNSRGAAWHVNENGEKQTVNAPFSKKWITVEKGIPTAPKNPGS